MYRLIPKNIERSAKRKGKVSFKIRGVGEGWHPTINFSKIVATYVYNPNETSEKPRRPIAEFHLAAEPKARYHMGAFKFVDDCRSRLKRMFLNLVIEKAIEEAKKIAAKELILITGDESVIDALLDFNFSVKKVNNDYRIYRSHKFISMQEEIDEEKEASV